MKAKASAKGKANNTSTSEVIVERNDGLLWGRVEIAGKLFTPYGETMERLLSNLKELVSDHIQNEGKGVKFWENIDPNHLDTEIKYDVEAFFLEHNYLKITSIAQYAGINAALVRQYASGVKHPSAEQAKKIELAIHQIARELQEVAIYA